MAVKKTVKKAKTVKKKNRDVFVEDSSILQEYVLDKTNLDEKTLDAIDDVEKYLRKRKDNISFVWNKFRKTACIFILAGFVFGYIIALILQNLAQGALIGINTIDTSGFILKLIKQRRQQILDVLENNGVSNMETYQALMGELDGINFIKQELQSLLDKQEHIDD